MSESKTKEGWIEKYVKRIVELWQEWHGSQEVSAEYIEHLKEELGQQYDNQLKRSMVELNYPKHHNG